MMIVGTKDLVGKTKSRGRRSSRLVSLKATGEMNNNDVFSKREKKNNTSETHCGDLEYIGVGVDSTIVVSGHDHRFQSTPHPNVNSVERAFGLTQSNQPDSNLVTAKSYQGYHKLIKNSRQILEQAVCHCSCSEIRFPRPTLQAECPCDLTKNRVLAKTEIMEERNSVKIDDIDFVDDTNDRIMTSKMSNESIDVYRKSAPAVCRSEPSATEKDNHTDTKYFFWESSKLNVFINGKPVNMSIPVPKYIPKQRMKKSRKTRHRERARELATHGTTMPSESPEKQKVQKSKSMNDGILACTENIPPTYLPSNSHEQNDKFPRELCENDENLSEKVNKVKIQSPNLENKAIVEEKGIIRRSFRPSRKSKVSPENAVDDTSKDSLISHVTIDEGENNKATKYSFEATADEDETSRGGDIDSRKRRRTQKFLGNETIPITQDNTLQHQQHVALRFLKTASDYGSMQAALDLMHDLHNDIELQSDAKASVDQAMVAIPYLMHSAMMKFLTLSRKEGGPGFAREKAKRITMDLFERMGPACCDEKISEDDLMVVGGLHKVEALRVLPHLRRVAATVSDQKKAMRKDFFVSLDKVSPPLSLERELPRARETMERRSMARTHERTNKN